MFVVPLARQAIKEIRVAYADLGQPGNAALVIHRGEHEVDLPSLVEFFNRLLFRSPGGPAGSGKSPHSPTFGPPAYGGQGGS